MSQVHSVNSVLNSVVASAKDMRSRGFYTGGGTCAMCVCVMFKKTGGGVSHSSVARKKSANSICSSAHACMHAGIPRQRFQYGSEDGQNSSYEPGPGILETNATACGDSSVVRSRRNETYFSSNFQILRPIFNISRLFKLGLIRPKLIAFFDRVRSQPT